MSNTIHGKLIEIQKELKAPKNQKNTFGGFNYRSCEDILEAVKPLCYAQALMLTLSDEIVDMGGWHYVKATVTLHDVEGRKVEVTAYAREVQARKGMDESQITGTASSYARKYGMNGLFCIDDTKDADTQDNSQPAPAAKAAGQYTSSQQTAKPAPAPVNNEDALRKELCKWIGELCYDDQAQSLKILSDLTSFEGRNGRVAGVASTKELKGQRLTIAHDKARKMYEEFTQGNMPEEEIPF